MPVHGLAGFVLDAVPAPIEDLVAQVVRGLDGVRGGAARAVQERGADASVVQRAAMMDCWAKLSMRMRSMMCGSLVAAVWRLSCAFWLRMLYGRRSPRPSTHVDGACPLSLGMELTAQLSSTHSHSTRASSSKVTEKSSITRRAWNFQRPPEKM